MKILAAEQSGRSVGGLSKSARLLSVMLFGLLLSACLDQNQEQKNARHQAGEEPVVNVYLTQLNGVTDPGSVGNLLSPNPDGSYTISESTMVNDLEQPTQIALVFEISSPPPEYEASLGFQFIDITSPNAEGATGRFGNPPNLNNPGWVPNNGAADFKDLKYNTPNQSEPVNPADPDGPTRRTISSFGSVGYVYFYRDSPMIDGVIRRVVVVDAIMDRLWENPAVPEKFWIAFGDPTNVRVPDTFGNDASFPLYLVDTSPSPTLVYGIQKSDGSLLDNINANETAGGIQLGFKVYDPAHLDLDPPGGALRLWSAFDLEIPCAVTGGTATADVNSTDGNFDYSSPCPISVPAYTQLHEDAIFLQDDVISEGLENATVQIGLFTTLGTPLKLATNTGDSISFTIYDDDNIVSKVRDSGLDYASGCITNSLHNGDCGQATSDGLPVQDGHLSTSTINYTSTGNGCYVDNETNLMWEVKVDSQLDPAAVGANNSTFNWYDPFENRNNGSVGNKGDETGADSASNCNLLSGNCNTYNYVAWANDTLLCGVTGWRMPKLDELLSLVNYANSGGKATVDPGNFFPNTMADIYWTATPVAGQVSRAWVVDFNSGAAKTWDRVDIASKAMVRLVRNNN